MATEEQVEGEPEAALGHIGPGARLQAAREAAGLSLEQVSQQLKLAPRQVRALEEEDFAQLPGRTFARGFVRNYARLLNLDGDDLLALLPDAARAPALGAPALHSTGAMIAELPAANGAQPGLARWLIPIVLVACIVGAATYEWYRGGLGPQAETKLAVPAAAAPAKGTELPNPFATEPKASAAAEEVARADVAAAPGVVPAAAPSVAPAVAPSAAPVAAPDVTTAAAAPSAPSAAVAEAALQLSYRGPSWTEIRDRNGQLLVARMFAAGSEQSIRGSAPFDIVIGNAREVTLVYRGTPVDLSRYTHQNVARLRLT